MEQRKDYGSPRDMLDDAMLQRILAEMNGDNGDCHACGSAGRSARQITSPDRRPSCGQERSARPCGCGSARSGSAGRQADESSGCPAQNGCTSGRMPSLNGMPLAMVYSPNQEWEGILEPEEALEKGTLFAGLIFPWYPSRCKDRKDCGCGRD